MNSKKSSIKEPTTQIKIFPKDKHPVGKQRGDRCTSFSVRRLALTIKRCKSLRVPLCYGFTTAFPRTRIPKNEALMFIWRDIKYVLAPPNPDPGDTMAAHQASIDSSFRYQTIPSLVQQAFAEVSKTNVSDESKDYDELLYSVRSTEKFGIAQIAFDTKVLQTQPFQVQVSIPAASAPVYDEGNRAFAELIFIQELKQGDKVVVQKEHSESFIWGSEAFNDLNQIVVKLPPIQAPPGEYELLVTVQDRISGVGETKRIPVSL